MICPRCGSYDCLRSHRRLPEYLLSAFGILPWRCFDCKRRFYGRKVPFRYLLYAHCAQCGNLDLMPIRHDRLGGGWLAWLALHLGARALRCDDCRNNFVTWRPKRCAQTHAASESYRFPPEAETEETAAGHNRRPGEPTEAE